MSSLRTPKKIIIKISKAIIPYIICFKTKQQNGLSPNKSKDVIQKFYKVVQHQFLKMKKQEDRDKCLWKKTILMGEKCEPLEFSGAIFYDNEGNQISEPPRTPRNSPSISSSPSLS